MQNSVMISLHYVKKERKTINFICNLKDRELAEVLYNFFDNRDDDDLSAFIASAPDCLSFNNDHAVWRGDCLKNRHYHLDLESLQLTVICDGKNTAYKADIITFQGDVTSFINTRLNIQKSLISKSDVNNHILKVFTRDKMIRDMIKEQSLLLHGIKNPTDPKNKTHIKKIIRLSNFLSKMDLSSTQRATKKSLYQLALIYENIIKNSILTK